MSEDQISISFKCKTCDTQLSWPDDIADSTVVGCPECGQSAGTYGALKETATAAAKEKIDAMLGDIFKHR
jgi:DNA-directed RNA polymerase subunit RPC12/RpoP